MTTQQIPDPKQTMDFLQQGGSFALLCLLILGAAIAGWFAGRALFRLLREFLGKQITQLESQTKLLDLIHSEQKTTREHAEAATKMVAPWGSPDWLRSRIDTLEKRADEIKGAISDLRVELVKALTARAAPSGTGPAGG